MGRIKTKQIKRKTFEIYQKFPNHFTENFEENKKKILQVARFKSKKIRDVIAGYITRLVKQQEVL